MFLMVGIALTVVVSLLGLGEIGAWIIVGGATLAGLAYFLQPEDVD